MDTALYFPYIQVPQTPWFSQVLLYWDRAATIVPSSLRDDSDEFNPYMRSLIQEGLLECVRPDEVLWTGSRAFVEGFLLLLDQQSPSTQTPPRYTRLHSQKGSWDLFVELCRRGLAEPTEGPGWEAWWKVEERTAGLYMAYLASALSGSQGGTVPVTDHAEAMATLGRPALDYKRQLAELRYAAVMDALPAPTGPLDPRNLRDFKEQNAAALRRCRTFLDAKLIEVATITDPDLREVRGAAIMQELEDDVAALEEQMKRRRWPGVTLVGFGGIAATALTTAAVAVAGGTALTIGLSVGAGALNFGTAVHEAVHRLRQPRFDPRSPLAYAALASRLA